MDQVCALCRSSTDLRESHIVPKFVVRWIQETSATGKLRNTGNVRRRHQDGPKQRLLCGACEQRFSTHEKWFAESAFHPAMNGPGEPQLRHPSLLPFVVSLAWRTAQVDAERIATQYPRHGKRIRKTIEVWRKWLLGEAPAAGHHYLFRLPDVIYAVDGDGSRINWYLQRGIETSAFPISHKPFVWWKIPGFAGLSPLGGHPLPGAAGQLLSIDGARPDFDDQEEPQALVEIIMKQATMASRALDELPDSHWETIARDYRKNLDEWIESPAAAAAHADYMGLPPSVDEDP